MKKYFYTTGFLFFMYFVFLTNYFINSIKTENDSILRNFTLTGVFFSLIFISIYTLRHFSYNLNNPFIKKAISYTHYTGIISFIVLLISHYLATKNIITDFSFPLSRIIGLHNELIVFIFGFLFFLLGLLVFNKSNHKVLGVCLMLLFLNGLYHLVIWHSYEQQKNITQSFYVVAVENNIKIKECEKDIACAKFNNQKQADEFFNAENLNYQKNLNVSIHKYLKAFSKKIKAADTDVTTLSYGDSLVAFNNNDYAPIGAYSSKNQYLIIDYKATKLLLERSEKLYYHMIGVSTICWLSILFILLATHAYVPYYAKKKLLKNKIQEAK
jgi:hypothetical protein